MSVLMAELGEHAPDLKKEVQTRKLEYNVSYLMYRKKAVDEKQISQKDAEALARRDTLPGINEAEYRLIRVKQVLSDGREILNALSSKLRNQEMEYKGSNY